MSDLSRFLSHNNRQWSATLWDGLIEAISARLAPLEEQLSIQREVTEAIIARGLTVIEQELAPIVGQASEIVDQSMNELNNKLDRFETKVTGGTVVTTSSTSATIASSATINLTIAEDDREFFAVTPHVAVSRASTIATWAICKVNSFTRSTGALSLTVEQVTGAGGPYTDWVITCLPAATMLQQWFYEQTVVLRGQVAADKEQTGLDRTAVTTARGEAVAARNDAVAARDEMRQAIAPPLTPPANPVVGQLWWDGTTTRVYDGAAFVPTVTASLGGIRFESGEFGPDPDGEIVVGGGFSSCMVWVNGVLLKEGDDYTEDGEKVTVLDPHEGDQYFVWAYKAMDGTDYYTKEEVTALISVLDGGTY